MTGPPSRVARPIARLAIGESGRIVRVDMSDPQRLVRLSTLGIVPGAVLKLLQRRPATIVKVAQTTVALDADVASEIWVDQTV